MCHVTPGLTKKTLILTIESNMTEQTFTDIPRETLVYSVNTWGGRGKKEA